MILQTGLQWLWVVSELRRKCVWDSFSITQPRISPLASACPNTKTCSPSSASPTFISNSKRFSHFLHPVTSVRVFDPVSTGRTATNTGCQRIRGTRPSWTTSIGWIGRATTSKACSISFATTPIIRCARTTKAIKSSWVFFSKCAKKLAQVPEWEFSDNRVSCVSPHHVKILSNYENRLL